MEYLFLPVQRQEHLASYAARLHSQLSNPNPVTRQSPGSAI